MRKLYSPSTGFCYLEGIHRGLPSDVVEISEEVFTTVIGNPDPGKVRSHDDRGQPILIDPPAATDDELADKERLWRDAQVKAVQWLRERHRDEQDLQRETTLSADQFTELLGYLQDLRDWPQSEHFPALEHRPVAPPWIAEQSQ